jgi:protein-S-isoprenylcysteine O-methyltransferase Ste14
MMYELIKWSIFTLFSIALIVFSWDSLQRVHCYGFFRFFAFEAILALVIVNLEYWFIDPASLLQIVSWTLLCGSIILAGTGFYLLNRKGKFQLKNERSVSLVKIGVFKYIRHPLYGSLLLFAAGAFCKQVTIISAVIFIIAIAFLVTTGRVEEDENLERFGNEYSLYIKTSKMFIPCLF